MSAYDAAADERHARAIDLRDNAIDFRRAFFHVQELLGPREVENVRGALYYAQQAFAHGSTLDAAQRELALGALDMAKRLLDIDGILREKIEAAETAVSAAYELVDPSELAALRAEVAELRAANGVTTRGQPSSSTNKRAEKQAGEAAGAPDAKATTDCAPRGRRAKVASRG
ncbi:MAG: hypothetical protein U0414_22385 [Polyangiaceae bacterium]